ncbi:MAG: ATP-dependent DNA helicase, partial [bacterium]|nr:ATP-dependent DNA helicase [bacterium]
MPTSPAFEKRYRMLNPAQKKAVDTIDGPVMVIAGPGTGKTEILTLRIANILLRTDTTPENILALTFTEGGAYTMRKRLAELMGARAYKLNIHTFHGFCNELITRFPERFPRVVGGTPITDADQLLLIEEILGKGTHPLLRPYGDPAYYVKKILSAIQALKRDAISDTRFAEIVREEEKRFAEIPDLYHEKGAHKNKMKGAYKDIEGKIAKNAELALAYCAYQERLFVGHHYDYDDMIVETVGALERDPDFLLQLQEEYHYILADEHQDTNNAQNRILELLASFHENPNLFIVGDEKQAIFRFQGASLANFIYFRDKFPNVTLISLEENYRSTQHILDSAHTLIGHAAGDQELRKKLRSQAGAGEHILLAKFSDGESEASYIAERAKTLVQEGVSPDEIAVFYRNNSDAMPFIRALARDETPFTLVSEQHILDDEDIIALIMLLHAVSDPSDNEAIGRALFIPSLAVKTLDAFRLSAYAADHRLPLSGMLDGASLGDALLEDPDAVRVLSGKLHQWGMVAKNKSLLETLDIVIAESGFIPYLLKEKGSLDRIDRLEHFLFIARRLTESKHRAQLVDFLKHLEVLETHGIIKGGGRMPEHGVRLMTAHKSKGLEFEHVFITGAYDGHWGGRRTRLAFVTPLVDSPLSGEKGSEDDERRLFYVALTRAKKTATITYPLHSEDGRELHPSQFIGEIDPVHVKELDVSDWENFFQGDPVKRHTPPKNFGPELSEREYLRKRFLESGFSVSALNNYLKCPWQYFFRNLVRLPENPDKFALYGTVVHHALEQFFRKWKEEGAYGDPGAEFLLERFRFYLERVPIAAMEYEEMRKKGEKALPGYHAQYHREWHTNIQCEFPIKGVEIEIKDGEGIVPIILRGMLDKVEFFGGNKVNVVDYKTAKPKSRNVIEGNTKDADGNYKRQLVFYKLLLDRYDAGKFVMETGEVDFIEPDKAGKYHKEKFSVT